MKIPLWYIAKSVRKSVFQLANLCHSTHKSIPWNQGFRKVSNTSIHKKNTSFPFIYKNSHELRIDYNKITRIFHSLTPYPFFYKVSALLHSRKKHYCYAAKTWSHHTPLKLSITHLFYSEFHTEIQSHKSLPKFYITSSIHHAKKKERETEDIEKHKKRQRKGLSFRRRVHQTSSDLVSLCSSLRFFGTIFFAMLF